MTVTVDNDFIDIMPSVSKYQPAYTQIEKLLKTERGHNLLILSLSAIALFSFLIVINNLPIKDNLFSKLYPQAPKTLASEGIFYCSACMADVDKNSVVGAGDVNTVSLCMGKLITEEDNLGNSCAFSDINRDGVVDKKDIDCIKTQFYNLCR